jgi:hypothetical protein
VNLSTRTLALGLWTVTACGAPAPTATQTAPAPAKAAPPKVDPVAPPTSDAGAAPMAPNHVVLFDGRWEADMPAGFSVRYGAQERTLGAWEDAFDVVTGPETDGGTSPIIKCTLHEQLADTASTFFSVATRTKKKVRELGYRMRSGLSLGQVPSGPMVMWTANIDDPGRPLTGGDGGASRVANVRVAVSAFGTGSLVCESEDVNDGKPMQDLLISMAATAKGPTIPQIVYYDIQARERGDTLVGYAFSQWEKPAGGQPGLVHRRSRLHFEEEPRAGGFVATGIDSAWLVDSEPKVVRIRGFASHQGRPLASVNVRWRPKDYAYDVQTPAGTSGGSLDAPNFTTEADDAAQLLAVVEGRVKEGQLRKFNHEPPGVVVVKVTRVKGRTVVMRSAKATEECDVDADGVCERVKEASGVVAKRIKASGSWPAQFAKPTPGPTSAPKKP